MSSYSVTSTSAGMAPAERSLFFEHDRSGSAAGQIATGIIGIALAIILVVGQISLATTKGIQASLAQSVINMREGNEVMRSVIERSQPTPQMRATVGAQGAELAATRDTMIALNAQLAQVEATTSGLAGTVQGMGQTSQTLATGVGTMASDAELMQNALGSLTTDTEATQSSLQTINTETVTINKQLQQISAKLQAYGLPQAQGAPSP